MQPANAACFTPGARARTLFGPEFSADGRILAAGTGDRVRFWDVFSGKEIGSLLLPECDTHIFHPDGQSLIVTDWLGGVSLRSLEQTGDPASSAYRLGEAAPVLRCAMMLCYAALSLDGRYLAVPHESEGEALIFDLQDPSAKPVVLHPHPMVDRIAISPDGRWVATSSWHNSLVKVWDARSGDLVRTLEMPARTTAAFSPDGRWLATSTTEYQLWEVGSWQPKGPPVPGHGGRRVELHGLQPGRQGDGEDNRRVTASNFWRPLRKSRWRHWKRQVQSGLQCSNSVRTAAILAALQRDQQVQLWDLRLIRQELGKCSI